MMSFERSTALGLCLFVFNCVVYILVIHFLLHITKKGMRVSKGGLHDLVKKERASAA